ncbi:MAG: 8-amino-7-oxononanoate synthase [Maribacter sp.]|nr:MAG: 8-amino-7-oxononanoate synthase [Maribacter sp.]
MVHYINSFPGREIILNNRKYLYFGGTSYLGLQSDEEFKKNYIHNIMKYGTNYGASRKSNMRFSIFEKAENHLAHLVGSEACITLSSGYLAGQFVGHYFNSSENRLFYAPNTHSALNFQPAVGQNGAKSYTSFEALSNAVHEHLAKKNGTTPIVLLDSIDFSGCNYPKFEGLQLLPLDKVIVIVDDSHGIGVVGSNGGGVYQKLKSLRPKELIVCCSLGKGFGIQAGAVFGNTTRLKQLTDTDFFGGASPAAPAAMASLIDCDHIFSNKRNQLQKNIQLFVNGLAHKERFLFMKNHPAFSILDSKLPPFLEAHDIILSNFNYPSEDADAMARIVISANHQKKDISTLLTLVNEPSFDKTDI